MVDEKDTVFVDNLPKDEKGLVTLIKEVNGYIRDLERQFFIEEDSEEEEVLKKHSAQSKSSQGGKYDEQLSQFKKKQYIQQFWGIPMSDDVKSIKWDLMSKSQKEHGGRLFDVITCDPPW